MSERATVGWFLLLVVLVMGLVGRYEYQDAVDAQQRSEEIRATAPAWAVTK